MRVVLVEPWLAGSHQQWAQGYERQSSHKVAVVGLEGNAWRWRLRGGALELARLLIKWVDENGSPDVLLVSGLVDVAQLVGLTRRKLDPKTPVVVYQHESQILYPTPSGNPSTEAVLHNWMSWCAADRVVFNSQYHRAAVVEQLPRFLSRLPDNTHVNQVDEVMDRFDVIGVGVNIKALVDQTVQRRAGGRTRTSNSDGGPVIVWPHRWESDKDPAAFVKALRKARSQGHRFRLVLAGEDPLGQTDPANGARHEVANEFGPHLVAAGPFERRHYLELLSQADMVVSCAHQEMFGVGVVEAMAAGCVPLLPDDLAYRELIPHQWREMCLYRPGRFATALMRALENHQTRTSIAPSLAASMMRFDWSQIGPKYDQCLEQCVSTAS